jgi:hypothetical protein
VFLLHSISGTTDFIPHAKVTRTSWQNETTTQVYSLWACCPSMAPTAPGMFGRLSSMDGFIVVAIACGTLLATSMLWTSFESTNDPCNLSPALLANDGRVLIRLFLPAATVIVRLDVLHEKRNKVYFEARQDLLIHSLVPLCWM